MSSLAHAGLLVAIAGTLVSCDTPEKRALSRLESVRIAPTAQSLVDAVAAGDWKATEALLVLKVATESQDSLGRTPLRIAVENGDERLVAELIGRKANVMATAADGLTVLTAAVSRDRPEMAGRLLAAGARAEATFSPVALTAGWLDLLPKLVAAGVNPNLPDASGTLPLKRAISGHDLRLIAALLDSGADPELAADEDGRALSDAAFLHADPAIFRAFADHGVAFPPARKNSWLWKSLERRDGTLVQRVLSRGVSPDARRKGWLPVEWAVRQGDGRLVKLLADYGGDPGSSLHLAALHGDVATARLLLALGADPDEVHPPFLDRPLSVAIRCGHDALAAALIEQGAALDFTLPEGQTPLHLAVVKGCAATVRNLLAAGMDANLPFQLPIRPEFLRQVRPGVLRWALKNDANVNLMMVAADSGDTATARQLLAAGARTETWTRTTRLWPINFASRRGDVKMMRLILGRDPQRVERRIVVRIGEQRARMFDAEGKEIFSTKVSTGKKGHDTPTGEYVITNKYREWKSTIYEAKMPYFQRLSCGDFGLHAGNVPGYPASHGCIRVPAANAVKLFAMTQAGDRVCIVP
jgi:ankyrin repeat protein